MSVSFQKNEVEAMRANVTLYSVYKKRLLFEIQISHNYSDLIVLKCVELMIRDKNMSYSQIQSVMSH